MPDPVEALSALGFTALEAEVYTFLLQESPATGYRVAQAIGKPAANTYKTLESLQAKGAVLVDEGSSRLCRAVPAEELLQSLDRSFRERREAAAEALARLKPAPADEGVYRLSTREQVLERARAMLAGARELAVVDSFPIPLEALRPDLEALAARGIPVAVQAYAPAEIPGARMVPFPRGAEFLALEPGQWLIATVDGAEMLLAFLSPDGTEVLQAVWSRSPYLSWTLQAFMVSEFIFGAVQADPETPPVVRDLVRKHRAFYPVEIPDFATLQRRFRSRAS